MKQYFKSISILILGISFFHLFSTVQVYLSNADLLEALNSAKNAGYLLMPNLIIMGKLKDISVAFAGGVFFTLSVGTLTVLLSFLSAVFFFRANIEKKYTLSIIALFFLVFVILLNINGLCLVETLSFLCVPALVFFLYHSFFRIEKEKPNAIILASHFIPVVILAVFLFIFSSGASNKIFSDFRDNLLMSNKVGMKINEFYYDYTLYPARVFKPYFQRTPKICKIQSDGMSADLKRIEHRLLMNDYLVVNSEEEPDMVVLKDKNDLRILHKGKTIVKASVNSFISQSDILLREFSQKTDKYGYYRQITALSLKTSFPLFMYVMMHFVLFIAIKPLSLFFKQKKLVPVLASTGCLAVGLVTFLFLFLSESYDVSKETLSEVLKSKNVKERIAGLRFVTEQKLDLSKYTDYDTSFTDNYIPEKYWFARSLGSSRDKKSYDTLLNILGDSNQNVVCQALYSLGMKRKKEAVPVIVDHINRSEDWYVQWYAYRALKRLRWKQKK